MKDINDIIFAVMLDGAGIMSGFAVWYESHTRSDKYVKKMARKNLMDEDGQYYFEFMKDYL
jgi:hypothetical protein